MKTNVKMTKLVRRVMTIAAAMLMVFTVFAAAVPAQAVENTPAAGGTTTFNKYLVMPKDANVPNVTFKFNISAGTLVGGTASTLPVYAGITGEGAPTIGDAVFTAGQATTPGKPSGADENYKYATVEVTANFSGISFPAPGVYRYNVSVQNSNVSGITSDATTLFLDVLVQDKVGDGNLSVEAYSLHADGANEKTAGFTSEYATNNLTLEKQVTGNQGDRSKYFKFTVNITNAVNGTIYNVNLANADPTPTVGSEQKTNAASLTATNGSVTATYYLKHGQSIVIQGLTSDTDYVITENDYTTDGYTTTNTDNESDGLTTGTKDMPASAHTVTFTNHRQGSVPTGVLLEIAPYIALAVVVIAGFVVLFATRRRREG